ncbi:NAD(P)/FAD-dependent oxidoreductase [Sediminibacillus massiliensis]|uniref:NAD(P)/FAD-dependent oxidoreductase n=1 Tax=Sediminibacillus massiliensis TaxID=1926277 RepID=UPI0009887ED2|nr:FAD-dependent oxidoreductase [Sediminibacillus massiliensis]
MSSLLIIGAGPAGLSAAITAARQGVEVTIVDEFVKPGGRLLGQLHQEPNGVWWNGIEEAGKLESEVKKLPVEIHYHTSVHHIRKVAKQWEVQTNKKVFTAEALLLATGAAERSIPIPGWTLPGVMTIGAAQVMTNVHKVKPGQKGIIVGLNVLSMAIAHELKLADVDIDSMVLPPQTILSEQESNPKQVLNTLSTLSHLAPSPLLRYGGALIQKSSWLKERALAFYPNSGFKVWGVPIRLRTQVIEIIGTTQVEAVRVARVTSSGKIIDGTDRTIDVDFVCIAGGLYPLSELIALTDCPMKYIPSLGGHIPAHNENMCTPVESLYVAGNITGIESAKIAIRQGTVAGLSIAKDMNLLENHQQLDTARQLVKKERENATIKFHPDISQGRDDLYQGSNDLLA